MSKTLDTFRTFDTFETIDTKNNTTEAGETFEKLFLVNVTEEVLRIEAVKFTENFDVCKCKRCLYDVTAIALNALPTKYVVTNQGLLIGKISSWEKQNRTDILRCLTEACLIVSKSPNH